MNLFPRAACVLLCLALVSPAALSNPDTSASWDRTTAARLAASVNTAPVEQQLLNLTVAGSAEQAMQVLLNTRDRRDWPLPAREAAMYNFTQQLRSLSSSAVPYDVITFLRSYQSRTLVPHEDHPDALEPLFNIRGVAAGVENSWRERDATLEGAALINSNPRSLVESYLLDTHPATRRGYLQALTTATPGQLRSISRQASRQLKASPELTGLAGQAALLAGDLETLEKVLIAGRGAELAELLHQAAQTLPAHEAVTLLKQLILAANAETASLAMAELASMGYQDPALFDLLLGQLADPQTGASAALTLARHASADTLRVLTDLSASDDPLVASRARLALELNRSGLVAGARP